MNAAPSGQSSPVSRRADRLPVHPSMAESARIALVIVAVASLVFLIAEPAAHPKEWLLFAVHHATRLVASLAGILLCRRYTDRRFVVAVLWSVGVVVSASSAYLATVRGDYTSNALISIALCVGSAAIIPWNWKEHLVLVLIFTSGVVFDAATLHGGLSVPGNAQVLLTVLVCMGGAMYTVVSLDKARQEIERRQREDTEAIDALTRDLERRVHERTDELEKANTELASANTGLALANAESEKANQELQGLTYSVSHDIRGALRVLGGQSHMLAEEYADRLDEGALRLVEKIRSGTIRIGQLVDALLALARVSRTKVRMAPVDFSELAVEVGAALSAKEPARSVELTVEPGLEAAGDPALLRILLENLLSNAWKFTRRRADSRIVVGSRIEDGARVFYVRDNGVGFNMDFNGKLFRPFEKLYDPDEFEGAGIGLAAVKRVVIRHGGKVWAEAKEGEGATFFFTLPEVESGRVAAAEG